MEQFAEIKNGCHNERINAIYHTKDTDALYCPEYLRYGRRRFHIPVQCPMRFSLPDIQSLQPSHIFQYIPLKDPTKAIYDFICRAKFGEFRGSEENLQSVWFTKEKTLEIIKAPSNRVRFQVYLEYSGRPVYLEYRTKPSFELKLKRTI